MWLVVRKCVVGGMSEKRGFGGMGEGEVEVEVECVL